MISQTNIALAELYSIDSIRGNFPKKPDLGELKSKAELTGDPNDIYDCAKAAKLLFLTHGGEDESLSFLAAAASKGIDAAKEDLAASNIDSEDAGVRLAALKELTEFAKKSPRAQFLLAVQYLGGGHIQKNGPKALSLLKKAAHGKLAVAQSRLGARFYDEAVANNDSRLLSKAAALFESAKDKDHGAALCYIAHMVSAGTAGYQKDIKRAAELYGQSSDLGFAYAKKALGFMVLRGIEGTEYTKEYGYRLLEEFDAALPDGEVKFKIACRPEYLYDAPDNSAKRFRLLSESVNLGYVAAYSYLGEMYQKGIGCEADKEMARNLYEKGISLGDARSETQMAFLIMERGDDNLSVEEMNDVLAHLAKGAKDGDPGALYVAANLLEDRAGCLTPEAESMYKTGARLGGAACQHRVALMYLKGEGECPADINECLNWLNLAVSQNFPPAVEMAKKFADKSDAIIDIFNSTLELIKEVPNMSPEERDFTHEAAGKLFESIKNVLEEKPQT